MMDDKKFKRLFQASIGNQSLFVFKNMPNCILGKSIDVYRFNLYVKPIFFGANPFYFLQVEQWREMDLGCKMILANSLWNTIKKLLLEVWFAMRIKYVNSKVRRTFLVLSQRRHVFSLLLWHPVHKSVNDSPSLHNDRLPMNFRFLQLNSDPG